MTVLLVGLGGLLAAAGTRLAVAAFVAAAVLGARGEPGTAAIATWTACTAAGWTLLARGSSRSVAVPALGAAAVLASASAPNGAVVLGLWVLGSAAAAFSRGRGPNALRWALTLCGSDVFVLLAVAATIGRLEGWPDALGAPSAVALLAAAAVRAPLAAGPDEGSEYPGLLIVRTQAVVLIATAVHVSGDRAAQAVVIAGAAAFATATLSRRLANVDVVQELALVAVTAASAQLGWGPMGWIWGALAAGTLIHLLRFMVDRTPASATVDALEQAAGIGLPFLPVVIAELEGAFRVRGVLALIVMLGLAGGIAGRARSPAWTGRRAAARFDAARGGVVVLAALLAALWAPVLALPSPPAGEAIAWPPVWAAAATGAAAIVGSRLDGVLTVSDRPSFVPPWGRLVERTRWMDRFATRTVLWAGFGALAAAALALWTYGLGRGFL